MPHVVAESDRLDEILVQSQRARDAAGDRGRLERVRHARAVVIAARVDEHLRLALQPSERLRMEDAVTVSLEGRAQAALVLGSDAPACLVGADRERREPLVFLLADALFEGV